MRQVLHITACLALLTSSAAAQIQPGPNLTASGRPYLYAPRAGYIGPPIAVHRSPPYPIVYGRTGAPSIPIPDGPRPPPPLAYAPAPLPPPLPPEPPPAPCVVAYNTPLAPLLNVRASPNGWIVGQLWDRDSGAPDWRVRRELDGHRRPNSGLGLPAIHRLLASAGYRSVGGPARELFATPGYISTAPARERTSGLPTGAQRPPLPQWMPP